jgi:hypothetical protein
MCCNKSAGVGAVVACRADSALFSYSLFTTLQLGTLHRNIARLPGTFFLTGANLC